VGAGVGVGAECEPDNRGRQVSTRGTLTAIHSEVHGYQLVQSRALSSLRSSHLGYIPEYNVTKLRELLAELRGDLPGHKVQLIAARINTVLNFHVHARIVHLWQGRGSVRVCVCVCVCVSVHGAVNVWGGGGSAQRERHYIGQSACCVL
jgi:hypothetical protein